MKVAISAKSNELSASLDFYFGRCLFFHIFDTETDKYEVVANTAANVSGGAGSSAAQLIHNHGASAVVAGNYGPHALSALKSFGIKTYVSEEDSVESVYNKLKNNLLEEIK
jgi:predicted Fe-Mo cluster-binding NifX family protein